MSLLPDSYFCIRCGEKFQPARPEDTLCPACSGAPDARPELIILPADRLKFTQAPEAPLDSPGLGLVDWHPGDLIENIYEVKGLLGQGGMGKVYRVHHQSWNIDLAVKCPLPSAFHTETQKQLFISEAETWINLGLHPHIVSCYYVRMIDGIPRLFAECVEGGSLQRWIAERKLTSLEQLLDVSIQFAWGLAYAHEQGLIHRDVKPANVLMTIEGIAKVTDFGLAKARAALEGQPRQEDKKSLLVSSGGMTPAYCSPEQHSGQPLTLKTDLWSWAVSLLELFTGEVTWYSGAAAGEALEEFVNATGQAVSLPYIPMPGALAALLRECFQQELDRRPKDMLEAAGRLQAIYEQEIGQPYTRHAPKAVELRADSLNNKALSLLDLGKAAEAESILDQALMLEPQHILSSYHKGLLAWRAGRLEDQDLVKYLEVLAASHPETWEPGYLLSQVHLERGDPIKAQKTCEILAQNFPQNLEIHALSAVILDRINRWKERLYEFENLPDDIISISPGGRFAVAVPQDNLLQVWDLNQHKILYSLDHPARWDTRCVLAADGKTLITNEGSHRSKALVSIDLQKGVRSHVFKVKEGLIESLILSPDESLLAIGSSSGELHLWDVAAGLCLCEFKGHRDSIHALQFSRDGRYLLSGSEDKTMKLWDSQTGACIKTFEGHAYGVQHIVMSLDGHYVWSVDYGGVLKYWKLSTDRSLKTILGFGGQSLTLSPDYRYVLSSWKGAKLWDIQTVACLRTYDIEEKAFCLSPDEQFVIYKGLRLGYFWVSDQDHKKYIAPLIIAGIAPSEQAVSQKALFDRVVTEAHLARERGNYKEAAALIHQARSQPGFERDLHAVQEWGRLYIHQKRAKFRTAWEMACLIGDTTKPFDMSHITNIQVQISGDARVALVGKGRELTLWDLDQLKFLNKLGEYRYDIESVTISEDGNYSLCSHAVENNFQLRESSSGRWLRTFTGHDRLVKSISLSPDGLFGLSASQEREFFLWDISSGRRLRRIKSDESIDVIIFLRDPNFAISGGENNAVRLWNVPDGTCLALLGHNENKKNITAICQSKDGRFVFAGDSRGEIKTWDLLNFRCVNTLEQQNAITSLSVSTDGKCLLSGSYGGDALLWDLASNRVLRRFEEHHGVVWSVALSPDARLALTGGWDGTLRLWFLDWELEVYSHVDWEKSVRPYLEIFMAQHTPYAAKLPGKRQPNDEEVAQALTRRGKPGWTEGDLQKLIYTLGCSGHGCLRPEEVRHELSRLVSAME
jgi:WD40 repeat protein/serine/threonine protein kinase